LKMCPTAMKFVPPTLEKWSKAAACKHVSRGMREG
jgi:hypothetical protein